MLCVGILPLLSLPVLMMCCCEMLCSYFSMVPSINSIGTGARKETRAINREILYGLSEAFEKVEVAQKKKQGTAKKDKYIHADGADDRSTLQATERQHQELPFNKRKARLAEQDTIPADNEQLQSDLEQSKPKKKSKKRHSETMAASQSTTDATKIDQYSTPQKLNNSRTLADGKQQEGDGITARRKSVRFSMKSNLVMTIGQKPLPEDIRTPPNAKPKGSALKKTSSVRPADGTPHPSGKTKRSILGNGAVQQSMSLSSSERKGKPKTHGEEAHAVAVGQLSPRSAGVARITRGYIQKKMGRKG